MGKDILKDLYAEYSKIRTRIKDIERERAELNAKHEELVRVESNLRALMLDYGDFTYETYNPKEEDNG